MNGQLLAVYVQTAFANKPGGKNNVILPVPRPIWVDVDIAEVGVNVIVTVAVLANERSALAMVIENCDTEVAETPGSSKSCRTAAAATKQMRACIPESERGPGDSITSIALDIPHLI